MISCRNTVAAVGETPALDQAVEDVKGKGKAKAVEVSCSTCFQGLFGSAPAVSWKRDELAERPGQVVRRGERRDGSSLDLCVGSSGA
jgi:hypothetical protein